MTMVHMLKIAITVLTLALLSGCEKSVPRTDYLPLRDGNRWDYRLLDLPLLKRIEAGQAVDTAPIDADLAPKRSNSTDSGSSASESVTAYTSRNGATGRILPPCLNASGNPSPKAIAT